MAGKRHPILTVLIILGVAALVLGSVMVLVLRMFGAGGDLSFGAKIGVIPVEGAISDSGRIVSNLVKFKKDNAIKAIILRINSPGGGVGPTQEIYQEVRRTIRVKKVIASMGEVAASGGYYIAAGANKIVANPGTVTGSIGVLMEFVQIEDLLKKVGIRLEVLKSGEYKDMGSPHRKLTEKEREVLNRVIQDIQQQFVEGVSRGRNLPVEKVQAIADGRIFSGARAKELDLVDLLGNFQDAVDIAKQMAGLQGEVKLVYPEKKGLELWDLFLDRGLRSVIRTLQSMTPEVEYRWQSNLY